MLKSPRLDCAQKPESKLSRPENLVSVCIGIHFIHSKRVGLCLIVCTRPGTPEKGGANK